MAAKKRVATTWLQGCSGCHMSLLDMHAHLLDILERIEMVYSPLMDIKTIPEVDIALVEGAVANEENEAVLIDMRKKAKKLVAFGTCACTGGITGLRNLAGREAALQCGYVDTPTTHDGRIPGDAVLPRLNQTVKAVHQVVDVDVYLPGCAPMPAAIREMLEALTSDAAPVEKTRNLCEQCTRTKKKMLVAHRDYLTDEVVSVHELEKIDPDLCFLEQGVLCMGPATREGCGALCPAANMPCRGCQGPPHGAPEQGAKLINCLSSILPAGGLMFHEDIVGVGYCFSMPVSIFPHMDPAKGGRANG